MSDMWSDAFELGSRDVHIIAINGIGMSAIARILISFGYRVNGSDINQSKSTVDIVQKGATIHIGHDEKNVSANTNAVVVVSSIIKDGNPELEFAKRNGMKVFHRIDVLAKIAAVAKNIVVFSGTHGKTSSTSLCAWVFEQYTDKFIAVSGGMMENYNSNVRLMNFNTSDNNDCDYAILEGDESDNSFIKLNHDVAIINNLNPEHLDYYKTFDALKKSVKNFLCMSRKHSIVYVNDENLMNIMKEIVREIVKENSRKNLGKTSRDISDEDTQNDSIKQTTQNESIQNNQNNQINTNKFIYYGKNELTDEEIQILSKLGDFVYYRYYDIRPSAKGMMFSVSIFKISTQGETQEQKHFKNIYLNLYGEHNIQNAMGVFIVANTFGMNEESIREGFATFLGTQRRFSILSYAYCGNSNGDPNDVNNDEEKRKGYGEGSGKSECRDFAQFNDFGITVVDDYAHHPNEVKALIRGARIFQKSHEEFSEKQQEKSQKKSQKKSPGHKLIMIFQPHKYSRLNDNFDLFVDALSSVDMLFILPVYGTSEKRENFSKNEVHLYQELKEKLDEKLLLCENFNQCNEEIFEFMKKGYIEKGDLIIFCGAGNITHFAHEFAMNLKI